MSAVCLRIAAHKLRFKDGMLDATELNTKPPNGLIQANKNTLTAHHINTGPGVLKSTPIQNKPLTSH